MARDERPAIIVAATPTSNGDLHLGHMAGPYLSGDIYARYLAATGRPVVYTTCTDDSQSYVATTARAKGLSPEALCAVSTQAIADSLDAMGITIHGLPPIDEQYRATVRTFVERLHAAGKIRLRTVRMPVARASATVLYDGLLSGTCPTCLAGSSGGVCESCGHPNHFDRLLDPVPALDRDDEVTYRDHRMFVLPLEEYRDRLTLYYAQHSNNWRPHARQLVGELLAGPLPDLPVTVPGTWGMPAPFDETPGQILYPWVEAMPAVMYSTWWAQGQAEAEPDAPWRRGRDAEVVYFHGYDNVYFWGLVDLVLLMAHDDRYVLPTANVCNEFYELDGQKFSTSRNHLVWSRDLLDGVPRDVARFYLALTAPEFQRATFNRAAMRSTSTARLVRPWNDLARALSTAVTADGQAELPTSADGRNRAALMIGRFRGCYALPTFSVGRAAAMIADQLERLRHSARGLPGGDSRALGDLFLEVRALLAGASPVLVDCAAAVRADGADLSLAPGAQPELIRPFRLPGLSADRDDDRADRRTPVASRA